MIKLYLPPEARYEGYTGTHWIECWKPETFMGITTALCEGEWLGKRRCRFFEIRPMIIIDVDMKYKKGKGVFGI